jgi:hypothetical protein
LHGAADILTVAGPALDGTAFWRRVRRRGLLRWDGKGRHDLARQFFKCAKTLVVGSKTYVYYSLPEAEKHGLREFRACRSR